MSDKIEWCVVKLKNDYKWWIEKLSNEAHIDISFASVIDPKQFEHILELVSPLQDYGFQGDLLESAFLKFRIAAEIPNNQVKLEFTTQKALADEEPLFLLPNNVPVDNEGPYIEFIDHIIRTRVKLLNDLIDFKMPINTGEIEELLREGYHEKYNNGHKIHAFDEIVEILEYMPAGYDVTKENYRSEVLEKGEEADSYLVESNQQFEENSDTWDDDSQKLKILEQ